MGYNLRKGGVHVFLFFRKKTQSIDATTVLDQIESIVYSQLKPLGFRRHGRTLHRFVSGDISQVIDFQYHYYNFYVNAGIRIPECEIQTFTIPTNEKTTTVWKTVKSPHGWVVIAGRRKTALI